MYHIVVEFQCLTLLWNSSVSNSSGIPVSHVIVKSSVSHAFEFPASLIAVEFQCPMWLCNSSVSRGFEIPVSHMAVKFQCFIWLFHSSVSNSCGIPVSHMAVEFQCFTWWWD